MMMMMRPNAFIHSFIRERERESAESLWSVVAASRRRARKRKQKRNETRGIAIFRRRLRRRRRVIKETKKRERLESTTQRNTFLPSSHGIWEMTFPQNPIIYESNEETKSLRVYYLPSLSAPKKNSSSSPKSRRLLFLLFLRRKSSSFCQWGVLILRTKKTSYTLCSLVGVRANSLSLSLSLSLQTHAHTQRRERKEWKKKGKTWILWGQMW